MNREKSIGPAFRFVDAFWTDDTWSDEGPFTAAPLNDMAAMALKGFNQTAMGALMEG